MTNRINLPLDILENIIDSLAIAESSDEEPPLTRTIKAFALVCHITLPICRKHIFASIAVNGHVKSLTTSTFYKMLTKCPHLAPYIRALDIRLVPSESPQDWSQAGASKIFHKLTRLQSLTLRPGPRHYGTKGTDWTLNREFLPLLHLPTITKLALDFISNFPISYLIPCMSLKTLWVGGQPQCVIPGHSIPSPISDNQSSIIIESFSWICTSTQGALTMSTIYHARRTDGKLIFDFSKLRVLYLCVSDLRPMKDFFGNCNQLKEVKINVDDSGPNKGLFDIVQGSLQTLEHLTVQSQNDVSDYDDDDDDDDDPPEYRLDPFSGLCQELEKISGQNIISSLTIRIEVYTGGDYAYTSGNGWGALEKVLTVDGFAALRRVSISLELDLDNKGEWTALKAELQSHFQVLASIPTVAFSLNIHFGRL